MEYLLSSTQSQDSSNFDDYVDGCELSRNLPGRPAASTIIRWATRGVGGHVLPSYKVGGKRFYRKTEVSAFLALLNDAPAVPKKQEEAHSKAMSEVVDAILSTKGRKK